MTMRAKAVAVTVAPKIRGPSLWSGFEIMGGGGGASGGEDSDDISVAADALREVC